MPDIKQLKNCTQRIKRKNTFLIVSFKVQGKDCTIIKLKSRKVRDVVIVFHTDVKENLRLIIKQGELLNFHLPF